VIGTRVFVCVELVSECQALAKLGALPELRPLPERGPLAECRASTER